MSPSLSMSPYALPKIDTNFDNLPMLGTEEEIELLYKILTKENLTKWFTTKIA